MLSPRSRREAIEQGKAELNRLYAELPETAYELSLRDLVEQPRDLLPHSGGLPVEQRQEGLDCSSSPPPELVAFGSAHGFFFSVTSSPPTRRARVAPSASSKPSAAAAAAAGTRGAPGGGFRPVTVKHISPRKVSPGSSPPPKGYKSLPGSPQWRLHKEPQVKPIFPVLSFEGANSKCNACSAHVIFFKSRCQVCSRIYCSACVKRATKCGHGSLNSNDNKDKHSQPEAEPTSKRSGVFTCWPFPIARNYKFSSRRLQPSRGKTASGDSVHPDFQERTRVSS